MEALLNPYGAIRKLREMPPEKMWYKGVTQPEMHKSQMFVNKKRVVRYAYILPFFGLNLRCRKCNKIAGKSRLFYV
jgi:hypothetical protein